MRLFVLARGAGAAVLLAMAAAACNSSPTCDPKTKVKLDFQVQDLEGRQVSLAAYQGRPLLLNFWATWCGPCKEEIPALMELATKYKSSNLAIVGISVDDPLKDLQAFQAKHKVNYPLVTSKDNYQLLEAYEAEVGVPVSWFVAANGCPAGKKEGGATKDWFDQQIKALL
jgi:peroxiredoxin